MRSKILPTLPNPAGSSKPQVEVQFISDPFAVREALIKLMVSWESWGLPNALCAGAEQVLAEVLNNVVEHAHAGREDGLVIVKCLRRDQNLHVEVLDNGIEMPSAALVPKDLAPVNETLDDLPEGGFGWFMIHHLTKDLKYQRQDGWNRICFQAVEA